MKPPPDRPTTARKSADADIGALVTAVRGGNREDIERLLAWAEVPLYRFLRHLCSDRDAALDITQDTLIELLRQLHRLRKPAAVKSWLFRVAARKTERWRRKRQREVPLTAAEWFETRDTPALRDMLEAEQAKRVQAAMRSLPRPMRMAMVLTVVEGFTVQEAARICQTKAGTIKSRMFHARQLLRDWLADLDTNGGKA